ncbi:MAG: hypothetical protein V1651_01220 [Patescibacteria group bacterium]
MKSKSFFVLLLITFFSVIITPEFAAATAQQQSPVFATEQMPAWLAEAGAVPVSDVALENVQGEFVPLVVAVWFAKHAIDLGARSVLDKLAEKYGWDIRFTWFAAHTCQ